MKLELAQQNLVRAQDVIREVVRQLNSLRRQAAKARRYSRLREELRSIQRLKVGMEEKQLNAKLLECSARFSAAQDQENAVASELDAAQVSREAAWNDCSSQEEAVNRVREQMSGLKVEASNAQNMLENQEIQIKNLMARSGELEREKKAIDERGELIKHETERLHASIGVLDEELVKEQETLQSEQVKSEVVQEAIRETEGKIDQTREFLLTGAGRLSDLKNLQTRCQENLERIAVRTDRLQKESEEKSQERTSRTAELEKAREEHQRKSLRQKEVAASCEKLEARAGHLAERLEETSTELAAQINEQGLLQHRFSSLEEIERRRSNYSEGVQKFLSTRVPGEEACQNKTLADLIDADPAYEAALEDYLNDPLQYILVDNREDAVNSVERLKRIGAGKCTFMTLRNGHAHGASPVRPQLTGDGVVGFLDDLLHMSPDVKQAFERALPDYASTVMVSDLNTAFRIAENSPSSNFLTLSGESYSPRGTLTAVGERKSMAGFLALKREKRDLTKKLSALTKKIELTKEEISQLKSEQAQTSESLKALLAEARKLDVEIALSSHEIARLQNDLEKLCQIEKVAHSEIAQLAGEKGALETKIQEAVAGIQELEKRSGTGSEELQELNARLQSLRLDSAAIAKDLGILISSHAVKKERKSAMEADIRRLAAESTEIANRLERNRSESELAVKRIKELELAQQEIRQRIEDCSQIVQETDLAMQEEQRKLSEQRTGLAGFDEKLRHLHAVREEAMGSRNKIEIEKTRLESDLEHLARNCQEEFHLPVAEIVAEIQEADWGRDYQDIVQIHERLREIIENFGAINMRALDEYQELDQRYQFLNGQRIDIEKSIADTQKAIAEINKRSIEQFEDAFNAIRKNFQEVFQILFAGGQCDLKLMDEGDILDSGIDIIAQPPGKRLQNVLLLSGGEKALTALALLIAIFRYRPSPLCILDEVDAPLDDANVIRFTKLLSELSRETQFIIITHNKNTMEIAETLYGVTMEEPGVSKILSVDFRQAQRQIA
jgi:chromosome segregation protein